MPELEKVLFYISAHFPPCAASGVFRSLGFIRYLVSGERRWRVTLLALRDIAEERQDERLLSRVPACVNVLRTGYFDIFKVRVLFRKSSNDANATLHSALPAKKFDKAKSGLVEILSYLMKTPDSYIGWIPPGMFRALLTAKRPDVVFATAPPFSALILGVLLKKIWRRPLVVDFRDPWVHNPLRLKRPEPVERWDRLLERWVLRHADHVIMNTDEASGLYAQHYGSIREAAKISTIYNGFDERFEDLQPAVVKKSEDIVSVVHIGALYGKRDPAPLIDAMRSVGGVQIDFFGPGCEKFGNDDFSTGVTFFGPIHHSQAIRLQKGADVTLVLGNCQSGSVQIPAKVFEILAVSNALWLIDVQDSPTRRLLIRHDVPHLFSENRADQILRVLEMLPTMRRENKLPQLNHSVTERFSRDSQAKILAAILHRLADR